MCLAKKSGMMILIVMIGLAIALVEAKECGKNETKTYAVHTTKHSWTKALSVCTTNGGTLAAMEQENEAAIHLAILKSDPESLTDSYWLGASCENDCARGDKDDWYWISNSKTVRGNWANHQPDNDCTTSDYQDGQCDVSIENSESVLLLKGTELHDRAYWEEHKYICETCEAGKADMHH